MLVASQYRAPAQPPEQSLAELQPSQLVAQAVKVNEIRLFSLVLQNTQIRRETSLYDRNKPLYHSHVSLDLRELTI